MEDNKRCNRELTVSTAKNAILHTLKFGAFKIPQPFDEVCRIVRGLSLVASSDDNHWLIPRNVVGG